MDDRDRCAAGRVVVGAVARPAPVTAVDAIGVDCWTAIAARAGDPGTDRSLTG